VSIASAQDEAIVSRAHLVPVPVLVIAVRLPETSAEAACQH